MDGEDAPIEFLAFNGQLFAAGGGQRVKAGAAVGLRWTPFGVDQILAMQTVERLIEGRVFDRQISLGVFAYHRGDRVTMLGAAGQASKNQQVERSL